MIHDYGPDGHSVVAIAYLNGYRVGREVNSNGANGAPVVRDPFGNVKGDDVIQVDVCLRKDDWSDPCSSYTRRSVDG